VIPFNRPILSATTLAYITQAFESGKISGDGLFTRRCEAFFSQRYGVGRCLMTTSCTAALELAALLCRIETGDEVILPSFTFVSTANAFALRGAKLVFADSLPDHPNIDPAQVQSLITSRTRVIVPVHYAGVAVDMAPILEVAGRHDLFVVEDAAQAVEATYRGRQLGTLGCIGAFSFHETKNIQCGEGGLLVTNRLDFGARAEILREKGTDRSAFFRGEVDKYGWVDVGSSYLPSDILAAVLWAQLEILSVIADRRMSLWESYRQGLATLQSAGCVRLPVIPDYAQHNAHAFYLVLDDTGARTRLLAHLKSKGILAVFHYQSLHASPYFAAKHDGRPLPQSDRYSDCLLRLPLFHDLTDREQEYIIESVLEFFGSAAQ